MLFSTDYANDIERIIHIYMPVGFQTVAKLVWGIPSTLIPLRIEKRYHIQRNIHIKRMKFKYLGIQCHRFAKTTNEMLAL